jgi:hypothetical protein
MMQRIATALMLDSAADGVARDFRGTETSPPRKLLLLAGGARYRVELEDVLSLESRLRALASEERQKLERLYQVRVSVDADLVTHDTGPSGPFMPTPPNERVTENPMYRPATPAADRGEATRKTR